MSTPSSQVYESFVPVYDVVPDKWEEAKPMIVENLKKITNSLNAKTIGFLLDEELLSGQQFIPAIATAGNNPGELRSVLRKVVDVSPLVAGVNAPVAHGIAFDASFTLIDLWVSGTNSTAFTARRITGNDVIMSATTLTITSPQSFDRAFAFLEFTQEI